MPVAEGSQQLARIHTLEARLRPKYQQLAQHPLYRSFRSIDDLHIFLEHHVFAVWDFMSLLKALQQKLTCVDVPWLPTPHAGTRRLVNEIVLGEESDQYEGEAVSHFELYLRAMRECGASTATVDAFVKRLQGRDNVNTALLGAPAIPEVARIFMQSTFAVIGGGQLHEIAAAFTFGREDLIPDMFRGFLRDQDQQLRGRLATFRWYLDRHIEVDGEEHGPMALRMVSELCGNDETKWHAAETAAISAIEARLAFWEGILQEIEARRR